MNKIEFGDCRDIMRKWAANGVKVQTCVTSPPYFGLRDYGHKGQIGLEETPEQYIAAMVEVFRCVWDVLEDDGTLWLNIGDSYGRGKRVDNVNDNKRGESANTGHVSLTAANAYGGGKRAHLRQKCLIGIPWRVALALQDDGWYLRQDIIWHKPNPMPESVRDRCTKAHEYIFLMSKSDRYFFDSESIREDISDPVGSAERYKSAFGVKKNEFLLETDQVHTRPIGMREFDGKRNRRSVWTVNTKPYKGAHFATFPPALIEPCILAGAPIGGIVLDPFMGSGTTAQVALQHDRQYLGCELNQDYEQLQKKRLSNMQLKII
jgi:DNA modification methylase